MKKYILAVAVAGFLIGCKSPPAGGNLGKIKQIEGDPNAVSYRDPGAPKGTWVEPVATATVSDSAKAGANSTSMVKKDSVKVTETAVTPTASEVKK